MEQRHARDAGGIEGFQQLEDRLVFIDSDDVGARHHHVFHPEHAEAQRAQQHLALFGRECFVLAGILEGVLQRRPERRRAWQAEFRSQRGQPPERLFSRFFRRNRGRTVLVVRLLVTHGAFIQTRRMRKDLRRQALPESPSLPAPCPRLPRRSRARTPEGAADHGRRDAGDDAGAGFRAARPLPQRFRPPARHRRGCRLGSALDGAWNGKDSTLVGLSLPR